MHKWLVEKRLPSYSRLWGALVFTCTLVACLAILLFGTVPGLLLCLTFGLVYSVTCFFCYHSEARDWRDKLDGYYHSLFIYALGYVHNTTSTVNKPASNNGPLSIPKVSSVSSKSCGSSAGQSQVQPSKACHREAQKIIHLIMRDFIHSWYDNTTSDLEFPDDVQKLLEHVALETNVRMQKIDLNEIVTEIVTLVIPYLEVVNDSGTRTYNNIEVFDVNSENCLRAFESNHVVTHRSLNSRELELKYYRQALDVLIQCAFPDKYESCDLACTFVRELLLKNIIEPFFDLLCDPDFLLTAIPLILKKASPEKVQRELLEIKEENEELERKLTHGRLILKIKGSPVSHRRRFQTQSGRFFASDHHSATPMPELQQVSLPVLRKLDIQKPPSKSTAASKRATWAFSSRSLEPPLVQGSVSSLSADSPQLGVEPEASSYSLSNGASPPRDFNARSSTLTPSLGEKNNGDYDNEDDAFWDVIDSDSIPPRGPIYCHRHVNVINPSGSNHVAYIFKFPKSFLSKEELERLGFSDGDTHLEGMKRYSQFDKLHSALLKSSMSAHVRGITLPSKLSFSKFVSKLSLLNREPDPVELQARMQGLEAYLQSVSAVSSIAESELFHEFLISGIESLRNSNIVQPQTKAAKKTPFLRLRRGHSLRTFKEPAPKAERIPNRQVETVLSAYLDTHVPLPSHSLHTLHSFKPNNSYETTTTQPPPSRQDRSSTTQPPPSRQDRSSTTQAPPSRQDRSSTLVNAPSFSDSPTNSVASASSSDLSGVPLADLAATPKAPDYMHMVPHKPRVLHGVTFAGGHGNGLPYANQSSLSNLSRSPAMSMEEEELHTVGSTTSLSSSSFVSTSEEIRPPVEPEPQVTASVIRQTWLSSENTSQKKQDPNPSKLHALKMHLSKFWESLISYLTLVYHMALKGLHPVTPDTTSALAEELSQKMPLTNSLLALGSEASRRHCPELWACHENTQLALLVLVGGGMERYMWKELKEVVYSDENWSRALYHLRHTLWPGGKFMTGSSQKPTEDQRRGRRKEAVAAIKKFLPNFLPVIVGSSDYDNAVNHVLDCLQNPKVTRYFILRIVELMLTKLVPELDNKSFQKQLACLRTLAPPPRNRFSAHPSST